MVDFNFAIYMENMATQLKDIGHNASSRSTTRFHRASGVQNIEEILHKFTSITGMQLVIQDNLTGGFTDRKSANILESPYFTFFLFKKAKAMDMADRHTKIDECLSALKKILARMRYDKLRSLNGLLYLDFNSVRYDTVDSIGDNHCGLWCSFVFNKAAALNINTDDWNDGGDFDEMI